MDKQITPIKTNPSPALRKFFEERPALSINHLEKEAGLPFTTLAKVVAPTIQKNLPLKHWEALEKVLVKYGWKR